MNIGNEKGLYNNKEVLLKKISSVEKADVELFIKKENNSFPVPLSDRVDLNEYVNKIINNAVLYGYYYKNNIIGLIAFYLNREFTYVTYICVNKEFQSMHLGSKLMKLMEEECKKEQVCRIDLTTNINNNKAQKFYEKLGYKVIERNGTDLKYSLILK